MTTTTNLGLTLPTVGADDDTWGGVNNTVHNGVDAVFKADGTGTSVGVKVGSGKTLNALDGTVVLGDAGLTLKNTADPTKIAAFQCSGITAGQTRTYTLPDASGTISLGSTNSTRQILTSGTAATYTTPAGCKQIKVTIVGGGGGGGGSGTSNPGPATAGTASSFNSITASGGGAATIYVGGAGGTGGTGSANYRLAGVPGGNPYGLNTGSGNEVPIGGPGGGPGGGKGTNGAGAAGVANTGGGGAGAGIVSALAVGNYYSGGGGSGETAYLLISTPAATYTYTVGGGGAAAPAGTGGAAGGAGGSGYIIVDEFY